MSSAIRNHRQVIERLCNLVSEVGLVRYHDELPHDCFCGTNPRGIKFDFQCDEEIIAFIESAVRARLSNIACTGQETGAAKSDGESTSAVSCQ